MRTPRKPRDNGERQAKELSPRAKLSAAFLEALEADFREYGKSVIETMRLKDPTKYAELAARMIAATEAQPTDDLRSARSMEEIGRALLKKVGMSEDLITDARIEEAVAANSRFMTALEQIAALAQTNEDVMQ
jgi:hypothetical protein